MASPIEGDNHGPMTMPATGSVKADGTFELRGLSGVRAIEAFGYPPGWILKAVRVNGADVTDTGVTFKPGEAVTGVEVILTSKVTQVGGTVKSSTDVLVKDYTVVIFAQDPERWTAANSRRVVGARPDQDGRFQIKNLPAGGYYAVATEHIADGEWKDPDVLEQLKVGAMRFSLAEGEMKTLELILR